MNPGPYENLAVEGGAVATLFGTRDFVNTTGLVAVCCLAALVGTFLLLRKKTGEKHYGPWANAWLLYVAGLALHWEWLHSPTNHAYFASTICFCMSAVLIFGGSFNLGS